MSYLYLLRAFFCARVPKASTTGALRESGIKDKDRMEKWTMGCPGNNAAPVMGTGAVREPATTVFLKFFVV